MFVFGVVLGISLDKQAKHHTIQVHSLFPSRDPFTSTDELKAAANTRCENPAVWVTGHSDYDKYGYVSSI